MSKEDKVSQQTMQVRMLALQLHNLQVPNFGPELMFLQQFANNVHDQTVNQALAAMPLEKLRQLQSKLNQTHKEDNRLQDITKTVCTDVFARTQEMKEYIKVMENTAAALSTLAMYQGYLDDNGRMSWDGYRKMIEHHIEAKCVQAGAHAAANQQQG